MEPQGNAVLWRPVHKDPQVEVGYGAGVQHSPQVSFAGFFLSSFEKMARLEGLEPPTLCFEGRCSIQLSYRRVMTTPQSYHLRGRPWTCSPKVDSHRCASVRHRVNNVIHSDAHAEVGEFQRIVGIV